MKGLLFQGVRFWHIVLLELKGFYSWRLVFLHQTGFLEAFAVFNGDRVRGTPFCTHFQLQHLECNTQTILVLTGSKTTILPSQPYPAYIILHTNFCILVWGKVSCVFLHAAFWV